MMPALTVGRLEQGGADVEDRVLGLPDGLAWSDLARLVEEGEYHDHG